MSFAEVKYVLDNIASKTILENVYDILSEDGWYGFIEHCDTLSSTERIEYIGKNANYTPTSLDASTGILSLNNWADFPVIMLNKPWMVHSDGTPDYRLDENDYTKREDGTASDVANTSYDGGAFAWIPRIYKQEYMLGNDRVVKFSMVKRDGFEPIGFIDPDGNELEGVWIPMFYGSIVNEKMTSFSGLQPAYNITTDQEHTAITNFSSRAHFFGGGIMNTLVDLLIMFAKNTDSQEAYGYGNSSGYDSSVSPTYGVLPNAVISGGQFYGTSDAKSLNKVLHSIVLGSYQQWQRDPYLMLINGHYKVSKNYFYDVTGATYQDTGVSLPMIYNGDGTSQNYGVFYPNKFQTIPGWGSVPVYPYKGSSSTGSCDGLGQNVDIMASLRRLGDCGSNKCNGFRCWFMNDFVSLATWNVNASLLLLPPAGVAV